MSVLIVESPAKCKTISKYLGSGFNVLSSYGHVRGLPSKKGSVLPDEDFAMNYEIHDDAKKNISLLVQQVKSTDTVYLATDPDREGEAISWHVVEILRKKRAIKKSTTVHRISFNEITKKAVLNSLKHPRDIDMNLVQAQQARQALDYLFGFTLSPLLWKKLPGSRSAGRVQSVSLRLICERENEIKKFCPEEYWKITVKFDQPHSFQAMLVGLQGEKLEKLSIVNEQKATEVTANIVDKEFRVIKVDRKELKRNPSAPFITSTLQQEASSKLGFTTKKTMMVAQKLYEGIKIAKEEGGLITYMRTDGVYVSDDFVKETRDMISNTFGKEYLPRSAKKYKSKAKNAQEAHEAIRPTDISLTPIKAQQYLTEDQFKLYQLIWNRMVASQMESAVLNQVSVLLESIDHYALLKSTGSTIKFDGFYRLCRNYNDDDEVSLLPNLIEGEVYKPEQVLPSQHFTQPPPRFNEASLVKKMEELGIGRPSTYASIISVLQDRNYVKLENKKFIPENRGQFVTAFLLSFFGRYVEYNFTAKLEESLDKVSNEELNWKDVLSNFWEVFISNIQSVEKYKIPEVLAEISKLLEPYIFTVDTAGKINNSCLKCEDGKLGLNIGRYGPYLSCSNYPECDYRKSVLNDESDDSLEPQSLGIHPDLNEEIIIKSGPYGNYLQCGDKKSTIPKGIASVNIEQAIKLLTMPYSIGEKDNAEVKVGIGRYGPYLLCDKKYTSIKVEQMFSITIGEAIEVINSKAKGKQANKTLGKYEGEEIQLCNGRYGLYIKYAGKNIALPKGLKGKGEITYEEAIEVIKK